MKPKAVFFEKISNFAYPVCQKVYNGKKKKDMVPAIRVSLMIM